MKHKVLIISDDPLTQERLRDGLRDYQTQSASNAEAGLRLAEEWSPEAVVLGTPKARERAADFRRLDEEMCLVVLQSLGEIERPGEVADRIIRLHLEQRTTRHSQELLQRQTHHLLGVSHAISAIRSHMEVLSRNDNVDLLVCGETGTGKEIVAECIHFSSSRREQPLVKVNCTAIPEKLLEMELFGCEKGVVSGLSKTKKGLFELADGGTVFLDEVGELPLFMQAKLMNFLETRKFRRLGSSRDMEVDVRLIAATNRDLEVEVLAGRFREDLFYWLSVMQIHIPPLRERREDIPVLCQHYLELYNRKFSKELTTIAPELLSLLCAHEWKGNVRELKNVMERSVLFAQGTVLFEAQLQTAEARKPRGEGAFLLRDLSQGPIDLKGEVEALEQAYIRQALALTHGNLSQAAELLGCTRFSLRRRLEGKDSL